jgi:hypothetical protein
LLTDSLKQVNWDQVATALNYKSGNVAQTRFNQIKKKMESSLDGPASAGSGADANTPTKAAKPKANKVTKTPAKPRAPRKGAATPVKKGGKGVKSAVVVTKDDDSSMEDYDMLDDEQEAGPAQKQEEFDDEKFEREMDEEYDEVVSTQQLPLPQRHLTPPQ